MCDTCQIVLKEVRKIQQDIQFLKTLINFNAGAAIQAKYVSKEEAMQITGLKKSALFVRQRTAKNPNGIFKTSKTGRNIRFYRKDLEDYVNGSVNHLKKAS